MKPPHDDPETLANRKAMDEYIDKWFEKISTPPPLVEVDAKTQTQFVPRKSTKPYMSLQQKKKIYYDNNKERLRVKAQEQRKRQKEKNDFYRENYQVHTYSIILDNNANVISNQINQQIPPNIAM